MIVEMAAYSGWYAWRMFLPFRRAAERSATSSTSLARFDVSALIGLAFAGARRKWFQYPCEHGAKDPLTPAMPIFNRAEFCRLTTLLGHFFMHKVNTTKLVELAWSSPKGKFGGAGKEISEE